MAPNKDKRRSMVASQGYEPIHLVQSEKKADKVETSRPSLRSLTDPEFGRPHKEHNVLLQSLGAPHVGSFNYMLDKGLAYAVDDIDPIEFKLPEECGGQLIRLKVEEARICSPTVAPGSIGALETRIFPAEARQRGMTYKGRCFVRASYAIDGVTQPPIEKNLGQLPIMLRSSACHLKGLGPAELVARGEQESEWGGTFVMGGHERILRMLQTTRRNYPIAMQRSGWRGRGKNFSDLGVIVDCCKPDMTAVKNVLHFVSTGTAKFMFNVDRELFFVPVVLVLKCLSSRSDAHIFGRLTNGTDPADHYYRGCLKNMLAEPQEEGLFSPEQIREYIGQSFRDKVKYKVPEWYTNQEVCAYLMRKSVCIHLDGDNEAKFDLVVHMVKKLFALVQDKCVVEGTDSIMMHELVLGGHVYLQLLKEKLASWLHGLKLAVMQRAKADGSRFDLTPPVMANCAQKTLTLERIFDNFISTGNLPSATGLGLMQNKGLSIMAENINRMRYMSHFRAIHRGSFFQDMRTTEVRALLPDAWGFVCPVHTPDGSPCGLLNHLGMSVNVTTEPENSSKVPELLADLGLLPTAVSVSATAYPVLLDGQVLGNFRAKDVEDAVKRLRMVKVDPTDKRLSEMTELAFVPKRSGGQSHGLFIFTRAARMMRPVFNVALNTVEWIGTFEQVYLDIAVANYDKEDVEMRAAYRELNRSSFLSNLARTIPLPDFNQSPRNMYQCQMGKQTMATPTHTWHLNAETKMYRLQTPTSPFFRPGHYDAINMDDYAMGTNAIVAVISYTGYDMEDAMIINRCSLDRGFAYGTVYKSYFVDLYTVVSGRKPKNVFERDKCDLVFERDPKKAAELAAFIDSDGLPHVGTRLTEGDPYYCFRNEAESTYVVKKYDGKEVAFVDSVKVCGNDTGTSVLNRVNISLRIPRPASIGDKFASRAGQKGICSQQWPAEDLPWTESGLVPDIVFNPHGFPSRMTIAMMIECMAGKSGAVHGLCHDATPFRFGSDDHKDNDAIDHFARQLEAAGYNYYGTETLYSGTDGVAMTADIFFGVIHYQRLRHMVSDKFQVRNQGPVDMVTRQPIKGRRRGGGVRFGEMERDCLLSHGSVFLLQDRLFHGSDKTRIKVCVRCGSLLGPRVSVPTTTAGRANAAIQQFHEHKATCVACKDEDPDSVRDISVPYIFLHLVSQLAAVNIKIKIETKRE